MPHICRAVDTPKNVQVCELTGRMDAAASAALKQDLNLMLDDVSFKLVVVMDGLELISASCLGVLLNYAQQVREHRGDIKFAGASPNIRRVMDLVGFDRYFKFFETEQDALDAFAGNK
jgi:anti-anti-sigma factor